MKVIRTRNSRTDLADKIKRALDKKPTADHLSRKGITPEEAEKLFGHNVPPKVQRTIGNKKGGNTGARKKFRSKPRAVNMRPFPADVPDPQPVQIEMPDWFSKKGPIDVSIIIPMYRSAKAIAANIRSWDLKNYGLNTEVIYVDDGCPNLSYKVVIDTWEERVDELKGRGVGKIIRNQNNSGYGRACNVGAAYAEGKYLIFMNADTKVTANWVRPMYDRLEKDGSIGLLGNLHLKEIKGHVTIDSSGSEWIWQKGTYEHVGRHCFEGRPISSPIKLNEAPPYILNPGEREMVTGACFAIPAFLWKELQGYDPTFRIGYWEDSDLNLRVREKGYKIFYEPESKIYHDVGHSGSGGHPFIEANKQYFYNRWVYNGRIDNHIKQKRNPPPSLNRVYIKRTDAHGDVLVAASVAAALKKNHPNCNITFATACFEAIQDHPHIDYMVPLAFNADSRAPVVTMNGYDAVYDLDRAYELRPHMHLMDAYALAAGVRREDCELFFKTEHLGGTGINIPTDKYVVMHAGRTSWVGRNWRVEYFDEIATRLREAGYYVVLVGIGRDNLVSNVSLDLRTKTKVYQTAFLIKHSRFFIGIDSFPMWMAQTYNKRGVCFFGCVNPKYRLLNDNILAINDTSLDCLGCHHEQPLPCIGTNRCRVGGVPCEINVTADMFWEKVETIIQWDKKQQHSPRSSSFLATPEAAHQ